MLTGLHHRDEMVGAKSAALFASRMSNERSAGELRSRKWTGVSLGPFAGCYLYARNEQLA